MKYKTMRLMCMFDLPVDTGKERKEYRVFRKELIKEGFVMLQYSLYVRTCPSREFANRLEVRIRKFAPAEGHILLLAVTEKQYEDMKLIVGTKNYGRHTIGTERLVII